jgi:hypothetical protein
MRKQLNITRDRYSNLIVISSAGQQGKRSLWNCLCDCGNTKVVSLSDLRSKKVKSCGCLRIRTIKELRTSHGLSTNTNLKSEYGIWIKMKQRCNNPTCRYYKDYGARGITVCESWANSFEKFLSDMGSRPSKNHTIERVNNGGNYEPSNCEWATRQSQSYNRRTSKMLVFNSQTKSMSEWCSVLGLDYYKVRYYTGKGLPLDQIVNNQLGRKS